MMNTGHRRKSVATAIVVLAMSLSGCGSKSDGRPTMAGVLEASVDGDWREPSPEFLLHMKIPSGLVTMELSPDFAPNTVENIRLLAKEKFFDGAAITRSQENYVVQWGDPNAENDDAKPYGDAAPGIEAEFFREMSGLDFSVVDSRDPYADQVGFVSGFPVGADENGQRAWLAHCYGMLGIGRGMEPNSGNGAELYVVTGHAPRHLDRNVVLVGRVIQGMELLTTLPRGTGPLGFYEDKTEQVPIEWIRFGSDIPEEQRVRLQIMRTDTETFARLVEARRYRAEEWFVDPAGKIGLCNVPVPVRRFVE